MTSKAMSCLVSLPYEDKTICLGKVNVKPKKLNPLKIDGCIDSDTHIILANPNLDEPLKSVIEKAPVNNVHNLYIHDHKSSVVGKYLKDRSTNKSGDTKDMNLDIGLLQDIQLPVVPTGDSIFLLIDRYSALENVVLDSLKAHLIKNDLDIFLKTNAHVNMKDVTLFISENLHHKITEHIDISDYFLKIVHTDFIVQGAIEYLMGKVIPPSNISYQCSFQFQSKVDIISTHISHDLVRQSNKVKFIGRSGGSIQLNTYNEVNEFYFLVMVKHLDDVKDLKLTDDTEPDVVYEFKNMMDLKTYSVSESEKQILDNLTFIIEVLNDIKEKLDFQIILANNPKGLRQIIMDNSDKVVKYLFSDISDAKKYDDVFLDFLNFTSSKLSRNLFNILTREMKLLGSPFGIQSFEGLPHNSVPCIGRQHSAYYSSSAEHEL